MTLIVWDTGKRKIKERTKTSNIIVDYFPLNFVNLNLVFSCMTCEYGSVICNSLFRKIKDPNKIDLFAM